MSIETIKTAATSLNTSKATASAAEYTAALENSVTEYNDKAQNARMEKLVKLPRADFWREYTSDPTYQGLTLKNTETGYEVEEKSLAIRITKLEKFYQLSESTQKNAKGEPVPNRAVSLFRDPHYNAMALILNGYLSEALCKDTDAKLADLVKSSKAVATTLESLPECFQKNNSANRLGMLQALVNAMLPEELSVKVLSCDLSYLTHAMHKAGKGTIKGAGEATLLDEVCYVIKAGLSFNGKERTVKYSYTSQSKYYCKAQ